MGFGTNLRLGLRWSSDRHLATMLENAWQRYETAKTIATSLTLEYSARGLIRHPLAYRLISIMSDNLVTFFLQGLNLAFFYTVLSLISSQYRAVMQMHLALCDIADIIDELRRRTARRRAV